MGEEEVGSAGVAKAGGCEGGVLVVVVVVGGKRVPQFVAAPLAYASDMPQFVEAAAETLR